MTPPTTRPMTPTGTPAGWMARHRLDSPLGRLWAVRTSLGLAGLWFDGQAHHPGSIELDEPAGDPLFAELDHQLARYWADGRHGFDLPLDPTGSSFQKDVWRALSTIAPGRTVSYQHLATQLGRPTAARAVGAAVGRNPLSIVVPCHRVLGRDGQLTGYAGGLARKAWLLEREGVAVRTPT